jgi:hypothetical protein
MTNYHTHRFQIKTKPNSTDELLIKFLKAKDTNSSEKERLLQAVSAFWLPLALVEVGTFSEKEIALYGLSAIQHLREQITHLSLVLSLQAPSYSHFFVSNLLSESAIPPHNGNRTTPIPTQRQEVVKPYTQLDGLEEEMLDPDPEGDYQEDFTSIDKELTFSTDTANQIDKIFGD